MNEFIALFLGVLCAALGGELFVRGAVGLARWGRISPAIIGATVAAFATSSPELSVSITSALTGKPQIALGDALGSNFTNVALILGIVLAISAIQSPRESIKRDFPVALLFPIITALFFLDGQLSRIDGLLMLGMFIAWLVSSILEARKQRHTTPESALRHQPWQILLMCAAGLGFLIVAGNLIVTGAKGLAVTYNIDAFVIGVTLVALGTSTPELATTIIAKLRGHDEVSLGTILGSNIFNGGLIVAIAAIIHPITVAFREVATTLIFGLIALAIAYPPISGLISRRRGLLLLVLYVLFLVIIVYFHAA